MENPVLVYGELVDFVLENKTPPPGALELAKKNNIEGVQARNLVESAIIASGQGAIDSFIRTCEMTSTKSGLQKELVSALSQGENHLKQGNKLDNVPPWQILALLKAKIERLRRNGRIFSPPVRETPVEATIGTKHKRHNPRSRPARPHRTYLEPTILAPRYRSII